MIVLILGKPGSGKGTQAKLLAKHFGLYYFSTGDFSRRLAKKNPEIDNLINKKGRLIPQGLMTEYITTFLEKKIARTQDILFDGYPRFVPQYKFLEDWLKKKGLGVNVVFLLTVSNEEIMKRLSLRERVDDKPWVIKRRIEEYEANTRPMVEYIKSEGKLLEIDGEREVDDIQKDLVEALEGVKNG